MNMDAIEFFRDGKRHIRVYYQLEDEPCIRESCFQDDLGWFVRENGLVVINAKKSSPIVVTRWTENDGPTQITVFYLDSHNNICQALGDNDWTKAWATSEIGNANDTEIAPTSQLAIARPDKDDKLLRVFYQGKFAENEGGPLREIRFDADESIWAVQDNQIIADAVNGTRLSAVSDKTTQEVRLYYQGHDSVLREIYCDSQYIWREHSLVIRKQDKLLPRAPISTISWKTGLGKLQIRVFTVTVGHSSTVSHMSYKHPNWQTVLGPAVMLQDSSTLASCRDTGANPTDQSPITVFFRPEKNVIDLAAVPADNTDQSRAKSEEIKKPKGIPISRGKRVPAKQDQRGADGSSGKTYTEDEYSELKKERDDLEQEFREVRKILDDLMKASGQS